MTDQELKNLVAGLAVAQAELTLKMDRREAEAAKRDVEAAERKIDLDATLKRMGIHLGNISNNQGDVAEEFFFNSLKDKQDLAGIHYDFIDKNASRSKGNLQDEFDIVMVNGNDVAIIEVKYKAHQADLQKLIHKKYENFKLLYPAYKDYHHHLGLASFHINDTLKNEALAQGVIVLQRKGDTIETFLPNR
ncbi:MAG: hypothetical protein Q8O31_08385 [Rhodocyclaceae bacterium]|nr:hypothetical protein [Rhodocyclaceae bacterium]